MMWEIIQNVCVAVVTLELLVYGVYQFFVATGDMG